MGCILHTPYPKHSDTSAKRCEKLVSIALNCVSEGHNDFFRYDFFHTLNNQLIQSFYFNRDYFLLGYHSE